MKIYLRRLRAYLALFVLSLAMVLAPMRAYAFAPMALGWLGALGGGGAAAGTEAALGAAAVNAGVVALGTGYLLNKQFNQNSNDCTRISITNLGMCNPPNWTRDANGNPAPPTPVGTIYRYGWTGTVWYDSYNLACQAWNNGGGWWTPGPGSDHGTGTTCYSSSNQITHYSFQQETACASGYTMSGSSCVLSDASQVKKPSGTDCQVMLSGGSWGYDPQNPACPSVITTPITINANTVNISPDGKTLTIASGDGHTATAGVTDNTLTVKQASPTNDDNGNPITQNTTTTITNINTSSPTVVNNTTNYTNGQGQGSGGEAVQPQNKVSCADLSNCNWSNLETQQKQLVEEQKIASATTEIASSTKNISDFLTKNDIPTDDIPTETKDTAFTWTAISLPASCPQPRQLALSFGSYDFSYQPICDVASALKPILVACAAISGLYICFGGRRDAS